MLLRLKLQSALRRVALARHFGPLFALNRTARLSVEEVSFLLHSAPSYYYFLEHAAGRCYEPASCTQLFEWCRGRTVTFLDIGAFYGYFTALMGGLNPENRVYSFEPNPAFVRVLQRNWTMNCRHGGVHAVALSDAAGTVPFRDRSMRVSDEEAEFHVPAITFDDWREQHEVDPDVVKLDVHGSEGRVLFGMQKLLRDGDFKLLFELHPEHLLSGYTLREVVSLLYDSGWEMAELSGFRQSDSKHAEPLPLTPERRRELEDPACWTEYELNSRRMFVCRKAGRSGIKAQNT